MDKKERLVKVNGALSTKITNMAFLCSLLVVAIHVGKPVDSGSLPWWVIHIMRDTFGGIAVPFFFVVSGYMLAGHMEESGWYRREMHKRLYSLVIPYLLWSVIALTYSMPISIVADLVAHRPFGTNVHLPSLLSITGLDFFHFPAMASLWYIRWLVCLCVLSPLIFKAVRKYPYSVPVVLFVFATGLFASLRPFDMKDLWPIQRLVRWGISPWGLFYFTLRVEFRVCKLPSLLPCVRIVFLSLGVVFVLFRIVQPFIRAVLPTYVAALGTPAILYLVWNVFPSSPWPRFLTSSSFVIYMAHIIVIHASPLFVFRPLDVIAHIQPSTDYKILIVLILAIGLPILLGNVLHRSMPKVSRILLAGR